MSSTFIALRRRTVSFFFDFPPLSKSSSSKTTPGESTILMPRSSWIV